MFIQRSAMKTEQKEKLRGGEGVAAFTYYFEGAVPQASLPHVKMAAEIALPPGASIGVHKHEGETEYYIFLEGTGIADDNGTEVPIAKGSVMATGNGAFHAVKNTGSVPLVFTAIIITG
jgi:mannose-6-phosphate isomerase-like protein (cupin superfamily)